jgi:hypothetical protein
VYVLLLCEWGLSDSLLWGLCALAVLCRGDPILQFAVDTLGVDVANAAAIVDDHGDVIATALGVGFLCDLEVSQARHASVVLQETVAR